MFASQLEIWFNEDAKFHFVPHMEHLQPEVLIPSLPPLYTCSIFSDYHILLPILHYESGIICSKETVTLTIFYFDNLMHCSYSLTVDIFMIDSGLTKTMLVFFFLVLSTTCLHWFCPFRLALSEAQHGEAQAKGVAGTKQSEEGPQPNQCDHNLHLLGPRCHSCILCLCCLQIFGRQRTSSDSSRRRGELNPKLCN